MQDVGIDVGSPEVQRRSWRWWRTRIEGLVTRPKVPDMAGGWQPANRVQALLQARSPQVDSRQSETA